MGERGGREEGEEGGGWDGRAGSWALYVLLSIRALRDKRNNGEGRRFWLPRAKKEKKKGGAGIFCVVPKGP